MQHESVADNSVIQGSDRQNRSLIITSWTLITLVCLLALVPVFGFTSWLIACPILFITLVMGIIVLSRGGTVPGLIILLASLIVAPAFIFVAPFVSSMLGVGAVVSSALETSPSDHKAEKPRFVSTSPTTSQSTDGNSTTQRSRIDQQQNSGPANAVTASNSPPRRTSYTDLIAQRDSVARASHEVVSVPDRIAVPDRLPVSGNVLPTERVSLPDTVPTSPQRRRWSRSWPSCEPSSKSGIRRMCNCWRRREGSSRNSWDRYVGRNWKRMRCWRSFSRLCQKGMNSLRCSTNTYDG